MKFCEIFETKKKKKKTNFKKIPKKMKKNEKREYDCKLNFLKFGKKEFLRKNKKKKKGKSERKISL